MLPNFIIIGAQKSATTYILEMLSQHPGVYLPNFEVKFFEDPEYGEGDPSLLETIFNGCTKPVIGIKRPDYFARPEVPERIKKHIPYAKLIVVLREPISRLVSAYYYYIKLGFIPVIHINKGLPRILHGEDMGCVRESEILYYGLYATHLERFLSYFPRKQLLILLQDDLKRNPVEFFKDIYRFLGLDKTAFIPTMKRNNTGLYSIPRLKFLTKRNRFIYNYDAQSSKIISKGGPLKYVVGGAITIVDQYFLSLIFQNKKPELDESLFVKLNAYYGSEIIKLEDILGRDLSHWKPKRYP